MNENDLMNALDDRADAIQVGPAPLDTMTRAAARTRRRNIVVAGGAALAVVAVVGVGVAVDVSGGDDTVKDTTPEVAAQDVPPAGHRFVGVGHAAISIPERWKPNEATCNQPTASTYLVDLNGVACDMYVPFPADATVVYLTNGEAADTVGWTPVEVDGADALRSPTESSEPVDGEVEVVTARVFLPEQGALFSVSSSISAQAVDDLLAGIVVLDGHVAVPGYSDLGLDSTRMDDAYIERLQALGLEVEMLPQRDRMKRPAGEVISVEPLPGTVVEPGTVVQVTAAR